MSEEKEPTKKEVTLEWKDYVALFIASLETVVLPLIVLMAVLAVVYIAVVW